jgi:hypothetical protein
MTIFRGRRRAPQRDGLGAPSYSVMLMLLASFMVTRMSTAFLPSPSIVYVRSGKAESSTPTSLQLSSGGGIFNRWNRFWHQVKGDDDDDINRRGEANKKDDKDDEMAAGMTLLLSIPARQLKAGGLRLFLMFYLMGMQNTPHRNAWRANQPSTEEYVLEMIFQHDSSARVQIDLLEDEIRVLRCGSLPSTAYLMQESVIVDGILDELHRCAFGGDDSIAAEDRLLIPEPSNAIEVARESLAFG